MAVGEKEIGVDWSFVPQVFSELPQTSPAIKNEEPAPAPNLEAGCVPAIGRPGRTWTGDTAAHPPEAHKEIAVLRHQWLPAAQPKILRLERWVGAGNEATCDGHHETSR